MGKIQKLKSAGNPDKVAKFEGIQKWVLNYICKVEKEDVNFP